MKQTSHIVSHDRIIARNAVLLASSLSVTIAVGLFTSRIVLSALGVTDYGVYAVVGSIVAMLDFLNSSMAAAASRFLSYERDKGPRRLAATFGATLAAHIAIALTLVALAETAGLVVLDRVVRIPQGLEGPAAFVYQCTIASAVLVMLRIPFTSAAIAREKMHIVFWGELANSTLRLAAVWALVSLPGNRLQLYAALSLGVNAILTAGYAIVCSRRFAECRTRPLWRRHLLTPILGFSGYEAWSGACSGISTQGITIAVNVFFGVAYNAAVTLCNTAQHAVVGLTGTVANAFIPRITAAVAASRWTEVNRLGASAASWTTALLAAIVAPCAIEAATVLELWLGHAPEGSAAILRAILLSSMPLPLLTSLACVIRATGRVRAMSLASAIAYLAIPAAGWIAYSHGGRLTCVYGFQAAAFVSLTVVYTLTARRLTGRNVKSWSVTAHALLTVSVAALAMPPAIAVSDMIHSPLTRVAAVTAVYAATLTALMAIVTAFRKRSI